MKPFIIPRLQPANTRELYLPGSKSIALRQLAISALVDGYSTLTGIPPCDDLDAMIDSLKRLGVKIDQERDNNQLKLSISGPMEKQTDVVLDARMSGASTRLLLGLAALRQGKTTIDGHPSLQVRTNLPLLETLRSHGCQVESESGGLPVTLTGPMQPNSSISIDGSISSQYITALLIAGPAYLPQHATACNNQLIEITGKLVSKPYLDITLAEMRKRGAQANWQAEQALTVSNQPYQARSLHIEGDATAASYFLALATLHNCSIRINNLGQETKQGDFAFAALMEKLGAILRYDDGTTTLTGPQSLTPLSEVDMTSMPDAALTLIAMAPLIPGNTHITGLSTLHHKECDRLDCSAQALRDLGVAVETTYDSITVPYCPQAPFQSYCFDTHHDHRMAMAFSTLGSLSGTLSVDDADVVAKTYPHYWQDYQALQQA